MDDRFLNELRRDPDPRFARELRARLRAQESPRPGRAPRLGRTLAVVAAAALVVAFALPSVRASAQAMLDLFRVRKFAAVRFDQARAEKLRQLGSDNAFMVFDRNETVRDPGAPQVVASVEAAAAAAGFQVGRPDYLPGGLAADTVLVQGAGEARIAVSEAKLRALLDALDLRDVALPLGLDGKVVEVRKPPVVIQKFHNTGRLRATVVQSNSPELAVPAGLDIERLAEIGLRVLGLDPDEARRVARTTDWRSTLLVPVPINASTFRQVTVHSEQGLLITMAGRDADGDRRREGSVVLWSEGDRVFGVLGNLADKDLLQMAESVR